MRVKVSSSTLCAVVSNVSETVSFPFIWDHRVQVAVASVRRLVAESVRIQLLLKKFSQSRTGHRVAVAGSMCDQLPKWVMSWSCIRNVLTVVFMKKSGYHIITSASQCSFRPILIKSNVRYLTKICLTTTEPYHIRFRKIRKSRNLVPFLLNCTRSVEKIWTLLYQCIYIKGFRFYQSTEYIYVCTYVFPFYLFH